MASLKPAAVGIDAGLLVLEDAPNDSTGVLASAGSVTDDDVAKSRVATLPDVTTETAVSGKMRPLCNVEVVWPSKPCLVLNPRLQILHTKPEIGFVFGSTVACCPCGNTTKRRKGNTFCRVSMAAILDGPRLLQTPDPVL